MRPFTALALTGAVFVSAIGSTLACGGIESWVDADPRAQFVATLGEVQATPTADGTIGLTVAGELPTGGWSDLGLVPVHYVVEPYDGIWEVYVMAIPPEEVATQVITPFEVTAELPAGEGVVGYRLISAEGCVTVLLQDGGLPVEDGCRLQTATVS